MNSRSTLDVALAVDGLSKKYCRSLRRSLLYAARDIGTELAGVRRRSETLRRGEFWALRDLSFELRRGEALGLVGPNGSGKTTLLRIIGGLIKPDAGSVRVRGSVAPLIALGAGFSPVLTGRENIYANLAILGLSDREVDERYDTVLEFAEIEDAIDAPVRTYSSGMAARLGFACAVHADPDIFLIDEVLAVGDLRFRLKCYRKLAELRECGTTFILVSHNPQAILSICETALYLCGGRMRGLGAAAPVLRGYEEDLAQRSGEVGEGALRLPERAADASSGLDVTELYFRDAGGARCAVLATGRGATFCLRLRARRSFSELSATLLVRELLGEGDWLLRLSTLSEGRSFSVDPGLHEFRLALPYCGLKPGAYSMKLNVAKGPGYILDAVEAFNFRVESTVEMSQCQFYQPRTWELVSIDGSEERKNGALLSNRP